MTFAPFAPFTHTFAALSHTAMAVCVAAAVSLSLMAVPNEAQAKAKSNAAMVKKGAKHAIAKTAKSLKSLKTPSKAAAKLSKRGKTALKAKLRKRAAYFVPAAPSVGVMSGLHATPDPLSLKSGVALVVDANSSQVLLEKNASTPLPIASITKLMTALVVVEAKQSLNEVLAIDEADIRLEQRARSRLPLGTEMTRRDALQLALMSSENRAANMLSRNYPGGKPAFVDAMNRKAAQLGMRQSHFVEGTGLSSENVASAQDLVKLVKAAKQHALIRDLSTQSNYTLLDFNGKATEYNTTNRLIKNPDWDIALQKTGFINAAGQCLVMNANIDGRSVIMVFLDSAGKLSRLGDAQRVRDWLVTNPTPFTTAAAHPSHSAPVSHTVSAAPSAQTATVVAQIPAPVVFQASPSELNPSTKSISGRVISPVSVPALGAVGVNSSQLQANQNNIIWSPK
jgi:serine-type D-Ala-D-Ala endopeptidase (penicillin-binding protein 7)